MSKANLNMWPSSFWKSPLSRANSVEGRNVDSMSITNKDSVVENGSRSVSSRTGLNLESFVASTPAPPKNLNDIENKSELSQLSDITNYVPFCPLDVLQSSTQIENVQSEKGEKNGKYSEQINICYKKEISSLSEISSNLQLPSNDEAILQNKTDHTNSKKVS